VVLSVAFIAPEQKMLTWIGVGNVQGVLLRADPKNGNMQESLLLRAGVVGSKLPSLQASVLPVSQGDTIVFATDGIQGDFFDRPEREGESAESGGSNSEQVSQPEG